MKDIDLLKEMLAGEGRHSNYQCLPPYLPDELSENIGDVISKRLDEQRFIWMKENCSLHGKEVIEIGSNINYFSIRMAKELDAKVFAYELDSKLCNAGKLIASMCGLSNEIEFINEGVDFKKLKSLPKVDAILFFNVLHHAGYDFDKDYVQSIDDWYQHAKNYLEQLGSVANEMVFQMGYVFGGAYEKFCRDEDILPFTVDLLNSSGWQVNKCAIFPSVPTSVDTSGYTNTEIPRDLSWSRAPRRMISKKNLSKIPFAKESWNMLKRIIRIAAPNSSVIRGLGPRPIFYCKFQKKED